MLPKKHRKYFEFHFQDSQALVALKYQVYQDKSIANTFFTHIKDFVETTPDVKCRYTSANGLYYSKQDIELLLKKLQLNIILLNKNSHVFDLKKIDENLLRNISRANLHQVLNLLHEDFEHNMNDLQIKYPKVSTIVGYSDRYLQICEALNTINNTIHELEGTFNNYLNLLNNKRYGGFYSTCLLDKDGWTGSRVELSPKDYEEFTLEQFFGQLLIGYDTTGKNLLHAYWTNDLKIIKESKITPQTSFSSNVLLYFQSHNLSCESVYQGFCQWYEDNNISQYGYSKKISEQSLGNIAIGKLKYINDQEIDVDSLNLAEKLAIVDQIKNKDLITYFPVIF